MSDNDGHDRERKIRERILHVMRANEDAHRKQLSAEEKQKLKSAAGRLDQMLKAAAEANVQSLKNAAARLDQMLEDLRQGKDVSNDLKRRGDTRKRSE